MLKFELYKTLPCQLCCIEDVVICQQQIWADKKSRAVTLWPSEWVHDLDPADGSGREQSKFQIGDAD
ncbi:hypothetical protein MSSAC_1813 [Methanosarcina siciliae C2J]|uniref:Uncharacterized protein n=1 Tax=Methanosarcina siciliae C2J TaxID=1434118 RepID=A0A0E3PPC5_9EURY|nr:hypothetical protein MSSAC_1813 [Methanosarcina siciliae C2J]